MQVFEIIIALLLSGTILAAIARRFATPFPALLALAGAGLALIPGVPTLVLDPELALALFVAPVLLDTCHAYFRHPLLSGSLARSQAALRYS